MRDKKLLILVLCLIALVAVPLVFAPDKAPTKDYWVYRPQPDGTYKIVKHYVTQVDAELDAKNLKVGDYVEQQMYTTSGMQRGDEWTVKTPTFGGDQYLAQTWVFKKYQGPYASTEFKNAWNNDGVKQWNEAYPTGDAYLQQKKDAENAAIKAAQDKYAAEQKVQQERTNNYQAAVEAARKATPAEEYWVYTTSGGKVERVGTYPTEADVRRAAELGDIPAGATVHKIVNTPTAVAGDKQGEYKPSISYQRADESTVNNGEVNNNWFGGVTNSFYWSSSPDYAGADTAYNKKLQAQADKDKQATTAAAAAAKTAATAGATPGVGTPTAAARGAAPAAGTQPGNPGFIGPVQQVPQPGDSGFIGPVQQVPQPGDSGFIGPVQQVPQPGDSDFIGPVQPIPQPGDKDFIGPVQPIPQPGDKDFIGPLQQTPGSDFNQPAGKKPPIGQKISEFMKNEYPNLASLGGMMLGDALADWKATVDKAFCDTVILGGKSCWIAKICESSPNNAGGDGVLIGQKYGNESFYKFYAHIEGERMQPAVNVNATVQTSEYLYKVTYAVRNPNTDQPNAFQIRFFHEGGSYDWYPAFRPFSKGAYIQAIGTNAVVAYSTKYYTRVCIIFQESVEVSGTTTRQVCNNIVQYQGEPTTPYPVANATTTAAGAGAGAPTQPGAGF
jgi:hypothetical protein